MWSLPELVEAAARCGKPERVAADALERLAERTQAPAPNGRSGIEPLARPAQRGGRGRAALPRGDRAARPRRASASRWPARTSLYGEWLRRENRRVDAREQLRAAHEHAHRHGHGAFAERARRELLATGETVRKRTVETRDDLTPQEAQIAQLAPRRLTNPEIGAQLFLSPRTVEWHLRKVFGKLGISSRKELGAALPDAEPAQAVASG